MSSGPNKVNKRALFEHIVFLIYFSMRMPLGRVCTTQSPKVPPPSLIFSISFSCITFLAPEDIELGTPR